MTPIDMLTAHCFLWCSLHGEPVPFLQHISSFSGCTSLGSLSRVCLRLGEVLAPTHGIF